MRRLAQLAGMALLLLPLHAAAAYGGTGSPSDPAAGSPGAATYQLPLEKGRADAAPKGDGGLAAPEDSDRSRGTSGTGSSSGSGDESFYRSENNFGSSSQVPGAAGTASSGAGSSDGSNPAERGDGDSANGGGQAVEGDGPAGASGNGSPHSKLASRSLDAPADTGNTSLTANVVLLAAILLLATGVGVAGARMSRSRPRG